MILFTLINVTTDFLDVSVYVITHKHLAKSSDSCFLCCSISPQ